MWTQERGSDCTCGLWCCLGGTRCFWLWPHSGFTCFPCLPVRVMCVVAGWVCVPLSPAAARECIPAKCGWLPLSSLCVWHVAAVCSDSGFAQCSLSVSVWCAGMELPRRGTAFPCGVEKRLPSSLCIGLALGWQTAPQGPVPPEPHCLGVWPPWAMPSEVPSPALVRPWKGLGGQVAQQESDVQTPGWT